MKKEKQEVMCKGCGKGREAGKVWGGWHKACRAKAKQAGKVGKHPANWQGKKAEAAPAPEGIPVGPAGATIPVHVALTLTIKVEVVK